MIVYRDSFAFCVFLSLVFDWVEPDYTHPKTKLLNVSFSRRSAANEYLVLFKNYYLNSTRDKYIRAALSRYNVSGWKVVERPKLSYLYPSDFDVITSYDCIIKKLQLHPAIKHVSLHYRIKRTLSYFTVSNSSKYFSKSNNKDQQSRNFPMNLPEALKIKELWRSGVTGEGVKVGVFDTGLARKHPHFRNIKERTNWTNDKTLDDGVSHGTFVSGIIASTKECFGIAPDVELHIFRVFTNKQVSYTSWFLDAFNYAMFRKINVINLSIGGPDFMDKPFVDKVLELSANKVIMVSAIGNDGPLYGTLNNPADQSDVIGVGGVNTDDLVAKFSSRGMTTWELPFGYGRLKPDIVTYGSQVKGSNLDGGCRSLSGTSVASPVVAGAIALLISGAPNKSDVINPSSIKQIIMEGATKLQHNNMFEQGYGKLDILKSMELLHLYEPKITLSPPYVDYSEPYMWPYSSQPMYCGSMPSIINVTILNGISVRGLISSDPVWYPYTDKHGELINVNITFSRVLWPWTGWIAIKISIDDKGCSFEGEAKGYISIEVKTFQFDGLHNAIVEFPMNVKIVPKPPRHKRILWDQFHNLQYPPGYIPRDNLNIKSDPLDWRSDHIHTNFRNMYQHLRNLGYYIETLGMPFTCFNASNYGTLLIVDPEEEFFDEEICKLQEDVFNFGLSIIVFGDWYNTSVMSKIKFFDENTREWWYPDTGGSNIPAINDLMQGFGISLTDNVVEGYFRLGEHNMYYASGSTLGVFPKHPENIIISAKLTDQGAEIINNISIATDNKIKRKYPIIGLFQMQQVDRKQISTAGTFRLINTFRDFYDTSNINISKPILSKRVLLQSNSEPLFEIRHKHITYDKMKPTSTLDENKLGRIVVMGDSNCIDSTFTNKHCFWLLKAFLEYTMNSYKSSLLKQLNSISTFLNRKIDKNYPGRVVTSRLHKFLKVIKHDNNMKKKDLPLCEEFTYNKCVNTKLP